MARKPPTGHLRDMVGTALPLKSCIMFIDINVSVEQEGVSGLRQDYYYILSPYRHFLWGKCGHLVGADTV